MVTVDNGSPSHESLTHGVFVLSVWLEGEGPDAPFRARILARPRLAEAGPAAYEATVDDVVDHLRQWIALLTRPGGPLEER